MRRGTPRRSMFSIAFGSADSDDVVANAIVAGVFTARKKSRIGTRAMSATGSSTQTRKTISAPYNVPTSCARLLSTFTPAWPTVYAIAAPTPTGANFMTNSVKRNMMSASDSHQATTGLAFSPMLVTASAKSTEKITICSTSPSAIAAMIDAGERWAMISPNDFGFAGGSAAVSALLTVAAASDAFAAAAAMSPRAAAAVESAASAFARSDNVAVLSSLG